MSTELLNLLCKPGSDFLGVRYPFICGAMTWVSEPGLVAAVGNAGGFGCLAAGNMPCELLEQQITETRKLSDKPFGVNLITIAPMYIEHLKLASRMKVPYIIFAGSFPRRTDIKMAKDAGARVLCFASTDSIATRMIKHGADALILEGMEAGGHVGRVTLTILLQQVLFEVSEVPVFVAGGIATGRMCAHLFIMGAAGIQLGTRFAVAKESPAHPRFKRAFIKAQARDAVATPQFDSRLPVVAVRALRNEATADFSRLQLELMEALDRGELTGEEAQNRVEEFWMGKLRSAVIDGEVSHGSLMAGQSVGLVTREMTVQEIMSELVGDTEAELQRVRDLIC